MRILKIDDKEILVSVSRWQKLDVDPAIDPGRGCANANGPG